VRALVFAPNGANRAVHKGLTSVEVDLREIQSVGIKGGFITKIIVIGLPGHVLKVRCWGAPSVARQIQDAAGRLRRG
jgi:hypothetical protein